VHEVAKTFVADIQANQEVAGHFVVADKHLRLARNGTPFLTLKLVDRTGEINGRIWERAVEMDAAVAVKSVVLLRARSEKYREELQLQVQEIAPVPRADIDPSDFLPTCPLDLPELWARLQRLAAQIRQRPLKRLVNSVLQDTLLMERFRRAPAAKSMHHAYLGGLLEHTVSVAELVYRISDHYSVLDRDLLLAGAIFHDLGKVDEFVYDLYIDYSDAGRLLGHMVQGLAIIEQKLGTVKGIPADQALLVKHLILSHHGEAEFGAVKLPMTREAFVLHFADDLDAKMNSLTRILEEPRDENAGWSAYQPLFERFFFRGLPAPAAETPAAAAALADPEKAGIQLSVWPAPGRNRDGGP
jgi:3'-5' exoribonuclease